ncbi:MAG: restriction endonuclease [Chloroflexi bacterium]|nr:restriction endonuclease [Chloroflexota bacterium]
MPDLDDLLAMSPQEFERLTADVLQSMGYEVEVSGMPESRAPVG